MVTVYKVHRKCSRVVQYWWVTRAMPEFLVIVSELRKNRFYASVSLDGSLGCIIIPREEVILCLLKRPFFAQTPTLFILRIEAVFPSVNVFCLGIFTKFHAFHTADPAAFFGGHIKFPPVIA